MGVVYLAARADEQYQKRVSIKLIKAGMDSGDSVRHFRRERQILAGLEHPNIARLLDGGTTDDGLPYIIMEYIEGRPLHEYCDGLRLSIPERLKIFQQVCSAVSYAHRNLVVHRDLKPGNILVTPEGVPRLLDFGIAKLLNSEFTGDALAGTRVPMTPEYASPEQVRGDALTTATDIYSLGVILYELLTGHRPYRLKTGQSLEIMKAVSDQEPERPSTAVGRTGEMAEGPSVAGPEEVSRRRASTPEKLRRCLGGDLDNIVLMALRKETDKRYSSAEAFSDDIRRYLEGQPVAARKKTVVYRAEKFIKRHMLAVTAAILAVLLFGGFVFVLQARNQALLGLQLDLAKRMVDDKDYKEALEQAAGILQLDPGNSVGREIRDHVQNTITELEKAKVAARDAVARGDLVQASAALATVLVLDPTNPIIPELSEELNADFRARATSARSEMQKAKALAEGKRGVSLQPEFAAGEKFAASAAKSLEDRQFTTATQTFLLARDAYDRARRAVEFRERGAVRAPER